MRYLYWVFAVLAAFDGVCHLIACVKGAVRLRTITKIMFMPLLLAVYCFAAQIPSSLIAAAMLLGWVGDVLLLRCKKIAMFISGACSFALGHILYLFGLLIRVPTYASGWVWLICVLAPAVPVVLLWLLRKELRYQRMLRLLLPGYLFLLALLSAVSLALLLCSSCVSNILLVIGALLFLTSDLRLVFLYFKKEPAAACGDFGVMLTYLLAQSLLMTGFCL